jgi:hypothetical protein
MSLNVFDSLVMVIEPVFVRGVCGENFSEKEAE